METVMLNTILGSLPLQPNGDAFYYSDYNLQATKVYHKTRWPCCSGTLAQAASDYRINAYLRGANGLYVNLYTPSVATYTDHGVQIEVEQSGEYPLTGSVHFVVRPAHAVHAAIHFRIPAWAGNVAHLLINGKPQSLGKPVKGFTAVERRWRPNDRLTLEFPMQFRLQPIEPETPAIVALLRGPLLFYGIGPAARIRASDLLGAQPVGPAVWKAKTQIGDRRFLPFDRIGTEVYSPYQSLI